MDRLILPLGFVDAVPNHFGTLLLRAPILCPKMGGSATDTSSVASIGLNLTLSRIVAVVIRDGGSRIPAGR